MKNTSLVTTPFEDLILGSQFVPVLAHANNRNSSINIGIFQCRKCEKTFLKEQEALAHYKYHVLESHKDHFSVVIGELCPQRNCCFVERRRRSHSQVHFHCSYCSFSACEILELPLHMEEGHLSFYKEVSLILSAEDIQVNKVYKCGECSTEIQGTVSILLHSLSHETESKMEDLSPRVNGVCRNRDEAVSTSQWEKGTNGVSILPLFAPLVFKCLKENQEEMQIEINPLELISTLIEEDQKSENPILPTQHFLLGHSDNSPYMDGGLSPDNSSKEESPPITQIAPHNFMSELNGFPEGYVEQPAGVFQCNQCNEGFKYQYLLVAHRKQVHQGNVLTPFKCHVCSNEFAQLHDLKRHMSEHSAEFTHFCQVCGYAFKEAIALNNHLVNHGKSPGKSVACQKESLQQLVSQSPILEKNVKCESCNLEFPSKSELTRHIVQLQGTCNPNKSENLRCATCGHEMPSLDALKEHRRDSHPEEVLQKKGFQCDYCGKTFGCRSNLRDHLVVHTGEKPYVCDLCGKAFSFIHNMKTHRLTHNSGRNEVCPYCDKAYKSKISLYYHMKKGNCRGLSTKEVPEGFQRCTECLQMFASEERFASHKAKGACQMSYRCLHCGLRCSSNDKLQKHLQKALCHKQFKESPTLQPSSENSEMRKRRRIRRRRHRMKKEKSVCCERCNNYNRDCCCTFSCRVCGKRVFSGAAFLAHKRQHLPPDVRRKKELLLKKKRLNKRDSRKDVGGAAINEEISNSESLADLSTFTAPNLLEPNTHETVKED